MAEVKANFPPENSQLPWYKEVTGMQWRALIARDLTGLWIQRVNSESTLILHV